MAKCPVCDERSSEELIYNVYEDLEVCLECDEVITGQEQLREMELAESQQYMLDETEN